MTGTSLGGEGELPGTAAEAQLEQRALPLRADDRFAVDALESQAADALAVDGVRQLGQGRADALVERVDQDLQALAATLDIEDRIAARQHDVRAGGPGRGAGR